jgi:hypothetical protein
MKSTELLIAVDESPAARKALQYVAQMAAGPIFAILWIGAERPRKSQNSHKCESATPWSLEESRSRG